LQENGEKGKDYSPPIPSGRREIGEGGRDRLAVVFWCTCAEYHLLYLDQIKDDDIETVCAHSHKITQLQLCIYNLNKSIRSLIWECDTSQRATGKT
jgi:hypothetical protein